MSAANVFKKMLATAEPAELGPGPRDGVQSAQNLNRAIEAACQELNLPERRGRLLQSLILLWHDHLEESHVIAQEIETADGAFVHGMMHRREPDYGNAKYWFRRVGNHPAFPQILQRVQPALEVRGARELLKQLAPGGEWDSFAFVDACERAAQGKASDNQALREVQGIETEVLLERFCTIYETLDLR